MTRAILHSDLNCFYASVEMLLEPKLRGKAVAVCGSTEERHGIVLAKSELAKKAGVKTGMANWQARQCCKDLIVVPPQYDQYLKFSKLTRAIYQRYTDLIEPFGMDESWIDVTGSEHLFGKPMEIAEQIRESTKRELGLTVSIGVSFNKTFAKLGSDMKKPDAITEITENNFKEKVWPLAADEMIYCGRATMSKLLSKGVHTIGEVAQLDPQYLKNWFGINGVALWRYANGLDTSRVAHRDFVSPIKSVGHGITCICDLHTDEEVWKVLFELSQDVSHRLRVHELDATGVQIAVRGDDLFGKQFQCKLPVKTQLATDIAHAGYDLFEKRFQWLTKVRAVTIRAIDLVPHADPAQGSLFIDMAKMIDHERIEETIEGLRSRFGKRAVTYAVLLGDLKMPDDGRDKVKMPGIMYQ